MRELKDIRDDVNEIDKKMRELFIKRMKLSREIAEYKNAHGLAIYDPEREAKVIEKNAIELNDEALRSFYLSFLQSNMDISKAYQHMILAKIGAADSQN